MQHAVESAGEACLKVFFPHLTGLILEEIVDRGGYVLIRARTKGGPASCPGCGVSSIRLHGHYRRVLQDLPAGGRQVLITVTVRRLAYGNPACKVRTFAEPVGALARRHARCTTALRRLLELLALALAGRAASRLADRFGVAVSRDTLIRLVRALPDPELGQVRVLGVDDFSKRRGHSYATLLVDMDTHRPIDVLDDRQADTLAAWLTAHPGVEIVCRDRAGAYADGVARGAPEAIQVADRFHLWKNLCEAVERTVAKHRQHLHALIPAPDTRLDAQPGAVASPPGQDPPRTPEARQDRVALRTRERHAAIHARITQGHGLKQIARDLNLGRNTIRRFARAVSPEELLVHAGTGQRPKTLEAYDPYLRRRWNEGCTNAAQLYQELRGLGYRGAPTTLRQYLRPWRAGLPITPAPQRPPTVRQATGWFLRNPTNLDPDEQHQLETLCNASPHLAALRTHVRHFAEMMTHRHGRKLKTWTTAVLADDLPELHSFVTGLHRDHDAVTNGLTLPYSSGAVEGNVCRIKALKRSRYGRANLDLLRKIILHAH